MPIVQIEEENLRLDSQDGVPGIIPDTELNSAYVALYTQLPQYVQARVHRYIADAVEEAAVRIFAASMKELAKEATHPEPDGWYSPKPPGGK